MSDGFQLVLSLQLMVEICGIGIGVILMVRLSRRGPGMFVDMYGTGPTRIITTLARRSLSAKVLALRDVESSQRWLAYRQLSVFATLEL